MENKIAKIPVASHGLHKHSYNYPWLSSINFGDVMPCYYNTIRKGESDSPKAGMYSQLMPIAHNAFATGRFNFKAIFVPYKLVWRPWYAFDQQTSFSSNGSSYRPERYPYISQNVLLSSILSHFVGAGSIDEYDIEVISSADPDSIRYYVFNDEGRRIFRILCALGCCPSFITDDGSPINILAILCYIKAYADYYFPNNYVGNNWYELLNQFSERDDIDFNQYSDALLSALNVASLNFYENSIFDLAWDSPNTPNDTVVSPNPVTFFDRTSDSETALANVTTELNLNHTPVADTGSSKGRFSQFIIDTLQSVTLWMKRRQLSGARLLDKFLVSRGISLPNDSARISYFLGERNIEIEVSGVENNTDVNLGELAGRGIASSGSNPLSFECKPDDDGIFFVIVSPLPDANFPVFLDGFACRRDYLDNYTAEYDKLGSAPVPSSVVYRTLSGHWNNLVNPDNEGVFGFLNQYWDEVQERPRLLGDFILHSKGATELRAYHTFRLLSMGSPSFAYHSYDFVRMRDNVQYQRLFYNEKQENLMLFLRWYGEQYKEKLPLGDSFEWDDDEMNRRVSVVVGGSQK